MAQALLERECRHDCRAESAGSQPAREVWPEVIDVMREIGIDFPGNKPKRLTVEMQLHADCAVTMAAATCARTSPPASTTGTFRIPPANRSTTFAKSVT